MTKTRFLIVLISFQICWFCCILGAANELPWLGPVSVCIFTLGYLFCYRTSLKNMLLTILITTIGTSCDAVLNMLGLLKFTTPTTYLGQLPLWFIAIWVLFALTFADLFQWLNSYLIAIIFGLIGGPLAYFAGYKLGAVLFYPQMTYSVCVIAITWSIMLTLFVKIKKYLSSIP